MKSGRHARRAFLPKIAKWFIYAILKTCRISVAGQENVAQFKDSGVPLIYTFWHRHIFFFIYFFRDTGNHPLVSLSRDGAFVASVAEECGMSPVRGSSSRGGARAFLELASCLREKREDVLITADGPKGPARMVKEGVVRLARTTGFPVVPVSCYSSRRKILSRSWDRFMIPLPFSRVQFVCGLPLSANELPQPGDEGVTEAMARWREILNELELAAMVKLGLKPIAQPEER